MGLDGSRCCSCSRGSCLFRSEQRPRASRPSQVNPGLRKGRCSPRPPGCPGWVPGRGRAPSTPRPSHLGKSRPQREWGVGAQRRVSVGWSGPLRFGCAVLASAAHPKNRKDATSPRHPLLRFACLRLAALHGPGVHTARAADGVNSWVPPSGRPCDPQEKSPRQKGPGLWVQMERNKRDRYCLFKLKSN